MYEPPPHRLRGRPFNPTAAKTYFVLNQLGTPGLGTFLAGYRWLGLAQMLVASSGFVLVVVWCIRVGIAAWQVWQMDSEPKPVGKMGLAGLVLFALAWFWALGTSRKLMRRAKEMEGR
jgi:hypothetical protein